VKVKPFTRGTALKIKYDRSVDAAYIYLAKHIAPGGVARTCPCDPLEVDGEINLDFDAEGRLIGIEVLGASQKLLSDLLRQAEPDPSILNVSRP